MTLYVRMREWQDLTPEQLPALAKFRLSEDQQTQQLVASLKDKIELIELRNGLHIRTSSFVGHLQIGDLHITIQPKLNFNVLLTLFRYAYRLRDLTLVSDTNVEVEPNDFQDLLIEQLAAEATELIVRGLHRQYHRVDEALALPRGRLDMQQIARQGGIHDARLPVIHHPRLEDHLVNRVLLAGLHLAARLTTDGVMRTRLRRLGRLLEDSVSPMSLSYDALGQVRRQMNRLVSHYEPVITLIELIFHAMGLSLEAQPETVRLPGFLFDMNQFFETLMSRFLNDHLPEYIVQDQYRLKGMMVYAREANPQRRQAPVPRPDFVVMQGNTLKAMLDAKYRNLWEKSLPRDMLYQLSVYALSREPNGEAAILYPVTEPSAKLQIIEISDPLRGEQKARVFLRPVDLLQLTRLLQDRSIRGGKDRVALAYLLAFNIKRLVEQ